MFARPAVRKVTFFRVLEKRGAPGLLRIKYISCAESPIKDSMRGLTFRSLLISRSVTFMD
jgi:hypothetical protein